MINEIPIGRYTITNEYFKIKPKISSGIIITLVVHPNPHDQVKKRSLYKIKPPGKDNETVIAKLYNKIG